MITLILPRDYCDTSTFAREEQSLFARVWQCVGFTHELANHHDFVTRDIGGSSVLVQNFDGVQLQGNKNLIGVWKSLQVGCPQVERLISDFWERDWEIMT